MIKRKRIYVVDDDPDILEAIEITLQMTGFEVNASLKDDAIQKIDGDPPPDLIILDIMLSGKDGREVCKNLKNQIHTKKQFIKWIKRVNTQIA